MTQPIQFTPREYKRLMKKRITDQPTTTTVVVIPTYGEAIERHETPLDVFVSRWEPVDSAGYKKAFREDLAALIEYIAEEAKKGQTK